MAWSTEAPMSLALGSSVNHTDFSPSGLAMYINSTMSMNHTDMNYTLYGDIICESMVHNDTALQVSYDVFIYASSIFVVLGLIGNALSVMVFSSKEMRGNSSNVYLLVLALSDSMYLVSVFLTKVMPLLRCVHFADAVEADIYNNSDFICKLLQFLLDFFSDYSTCLIMAFTIERFIAVYMPVRFKELCTVRRSQLVCLGFLLLITVLIAPYHMLYMGQHEQYDVCIMLTNYESLFSDLYIAEMVILRVVPVFIIAVLNVYIIIKVTAITREKRRRNKPHVKSMAVKKPKHEDRSLQLTIMLILVSSTYIIVYIPVLIAFVLYKLEHAHDVAIAHNTIVIALNYSKVLYIFGFAINFFLYTVSGRVFREQLELILCDKRLRRDNKHNAETTTLV